MKTTVITSEKLDEMGFKKDGDCYKLVFHDHDGIEYYPDKHTVFMQNTISGNTYHMYMPCYSLEQLRYYMNFMGFRHDLALQYPQRFALVVNRCVYCHHDDIWEWVPLAALSDRHNIVFKTKSEWTNETVFTFTELEQRAFMSNGVFMDYDMLTKQD